MVVIEFTKTNLAQTTILYPSLHISYRVGKDHVKTAKIIICIKRVVAAVVVAAAAVATAAAAVATAAAAAAAAAAATKAAQI